MSNILFDENHNTTEIANNCVELFKQHNHNLISNFCSQLLDNNCSNHDLVIMGQLLRDVFYGEWLYHSGMEQIKRKHNPRFEKEKQIDG